jgi:hypothetical protein
MAALLKLRNFQFRFIDFLARAAPKSSRDASRLGIQISLQTRDKREAITRPSGNASLVAAAVRRCEGARTDGRECAVRPQDRQSD